MVSLDLFRTDYWCWPWPWPSSCGTLWVTFFLFGTMVARKLGGCFVLLDVLQALRVCTALGRLFLARELAGPLSSTAPDKVLCGMHFDLCTFPVIFDLSSFQIGSMGQMSRELGVACDAVAHVD